MNGGPCRVRTALGKLLSWLLPGRGDHRATTSTGVLAVAAWPPADTARRRLVRVRRVPPGLLPLCGTDSGLVRPHVPASQARLRAAQDARRRELEESVRRLNTWSSGGGGRR